MIDKICKWLLKKVRKEMPDIDDERAEVILYGINLIVGEIPKILIMFLVAFILQVGWLTIFAFISMLPYKTVAGGFHLKTHLGCTIGTFLVYIGNSILSKFIIIEPIWIKYLIGAVVWVISIIMISLYAPADTINLPILRKKERKIKKILSYIMATATLAAAMIINNNIISNILLINVIIETFSISKLAYILTKNEYGYIAYARQEVIS